MERWNFMKKNITIAILSVMVVGLIGVIVCMNLKEAENQKTIDKVQEKEENKKNRRYIRYTSTELKSELKFEQDTQEGIGMKVAIKNGRLVETSNRGLSFHGINGKVKYFTYDVDCQGGIGFLVLTEDKRLYAASYDYSGKRGISSKNIVFKEVKTNEQIEDITEYVEASCSAINIGVVLENGKIYAVTGFFDEDYQLGNIDYSIYKGKFFHLYIYEDDTIALHENEKDKIKYEDKKLLAQKIYINYGNGTMVDYYLLDKENKFYKIDVTYLAWNGYNGHTYVEAVSLMKESTVSSIEENQDNIKVTFKDGTMQTFKVDMEKYGVYENLE